MAVKKPKKPKVSEAEQSRGPRPGDLPAAAIPDFDDGAALESLNGFDPLARTLIRHLGSILAVGEEARRSGLVRTLASSEQAWRMTTAVAEVENAIQACATSLRPLSNGLEAWKEGERRSRRSRFERIAVEMGWKVIGSWPEPVIEGIVFVGVEELKDRASINGRPVTAPTAERIADRVATELQQLAEHQTAPAEFAASVWRAYKSAGGSPGHGILVRDLLAEIVWLRQSKAFQCDPRQDLYRGYSAAQFRADLTNYLSAGAPPAEEAGKQYELEVVGGSFAQEGLFMYFPQSDRLATCGRLTFKSVER